MEKSKTSRENALGGLYTVYKSRQGNEIVGAFAVNDQVNLMFKRIGLGTAITVLILLAMTGCSTVGYYSQIVAGHMRIVVGKKSVEEVVENENTDDLTRRRLNFALAARDFGVDELLLPDNESYTTFYDTRRNYVTWNVVAAGEFSFQPKSWCFPIAGCVSYRGYYQLSDAQAYADDLAGEGMDVALNGATAYSTLGWFADPLLNTMLNRSDASLASLIFHELAHQQLYVGDDSTFNESFASFVEDQGLRRWLELHGSEDQLAVLEQRRSRQQDFIKLLSTTRDDLQSLYDSDVDETVMRAKKSARYRKLLSEYETLKASWNGYEGYDRWFEQDLNNARLVSVATYNDYIPAFGVLFADSGSDFPAFYAAAEALSKLPHEKRQESMQALLERAGNSESAASL